MKKILALALAFVATSAYAAVGGTDHDLSVTGTSACRYCHTPHNSNPGAGRGAPIWARTNPTNTITPYAKFSANLSAPGMSLLCMSCHDGLTSLGTMYGTALTYNTSRTISGVTNIGTSLTNDHPVGIVYDTSLAAYGLTTLSDATSHGFVFFDSNGQTGGDIMECGSCHDPHVTSTNSSDAVYKFKRALVGQTDFCIACHLNK